MLTGTQTDPPEQAPATRRQALKYMERFGRWARKLDDNDLGMVVAFCANVQMAWNDGRAQPTDSAAQVAEGTAPIELPGLGAPFNEDTDTGVVLSGVPHAPDANCITAVDGGCIGGTFAGKEPCMHDTKVDGE